jgi:hypothetical protein
LSPESSNSSDVALGWTWALNKLFAEKCREENGRNSELVGTGFVARDVMEIVDALGGDGLLRYWGKFSRTGAILVLD